MNAAERCAAAVWRDVLPDQLEPPVCVQHWATADGERPLSLESSVVEFDVAGRYELRNPGWRSVSRAEVEALDWWRSRWQPRREAGTCGDSAV